MNPHYEEQILEEMRRKRAEARRLVQTHQDQHGSAIKLLWDAIEEATKGKLDAHPEVLDCREELAIIYIDKRLFPLAFQQRAIIFLHLIEDPDHESDHPAVMRTRHSLLEYLFNSKDYEEVEKVALGGNPYKNIPEIDPDHVEIVSRLANHLLSSKKFQASVDVFRTLLKHYCDQNGDTDVTTVHSRWGLAKALFEVHKLDEARNIALDNRHILEAEKHGNQLFLNRHQKLVQACENELKHQEAAVQQSEPGVKEATQSLPPNDASAGPSAGKWSAQKNPQKEITATPSTLTYAQIARNASRPLQPSAPSLDQDRTQIRGRSSALGRKSGGPDNNTRKSAEKLPPSPSPKPDRLLGSKILQPSAPGYQTRDRNRLNIDAHGQRHFQQASSNVSEFSDDTLVHSQEFLRPTTQLGGLRKQHDTAIVTRYPERLPIPSSRRPVTQDIGRHDERSRMQHTPSQPPSQLKPGKGSSSAFWRNPNISIPLEEDDATAGAESGHKSGHGVLHQPTPSNIDALTLSTGLKRVKTETSSTGSWAESAIGTRPRALTLDIDSAISDSERMAGYLNKDLAFQDVNVANRARQPIGPSRSDKIPTPAKLSPREDDQTSNFSLPTEFRQGLQKSLDRTKKTLQAGIEKVWPHQENKALPVEIEMRAPVREVLASSSISPYATSPVHASPITFQPPSMPRDSSQGHDGAWHDATDHQDHIGDNLEVSALADKWLCDPDHLPQAQKLVGQSKVDIEANKVKICVLDTGLDGSHPFLDDAPWKEMGVDGKPKQGDSWGSRVKGCIWFDQNGKMQEEPAWATWKKDGHTQGYVDNVGHGTHCAGLLLRVASNASIYIARVIRDGTNEPDANCVAQAIRHAAMVWQVDIISMSLGYKNKQDQIAEAIDEVSGRVLIFAAAANHAASEKKIAFPASMGSVICIKSARGNSVSSTFNPSNHTDAGQNFCALGEGVLSMWPVTDEWNGFRTLQKRMSGTSVATPIAAACAALVLEFVRQTDERHSHHLADSKALLKTSKKDSITRLFLEKMTEDAKGDPLKFIVPWRLFEIDHSSLYNNRGNAASQIFNCLRAH